MQYTKLAFALAFTSGAFARGGSDNTAADPTSTSSDNNDSTGTSLSADAIQSGSFVDGTNALGSEAGQAASLTSQNNFINNCAGKTLTNGLQITTGSCNGITMGDIPAKTNMVSSVITFPTTGGKAIQADTDFNITVQMSNLVAGSFTNADSTYYAAPQSLSGGKVVGHTHVTVQDMGNDLNPTQPLDPSGFAFFKGINDAGNGQGLLSAAVTGGLPAGNYRVCTMASASNHQPVLMPVAQRGTADDCTKFTVEGNGNTANEASNDGSKGVTAAAIASEAVAAATNPAVATSVSAAEAAAAAAAATTETRAAATTTTTDSNDKGNDKGNADASAATTTAASADKGNNEGNKGTDTSGNAVATGSARNGQNGEKGFGRGGHDGRRTRGRFARRRFIE